MHKIVVASEPYEHRALYRWQVSGLQVIAAGIALTEDGAWRQAKAVATGTVPGMSALPGPTQSPALDG
jgi:hypothetical protein